MTETIHKALLQVQKQIEAKKQLRDRLNTEIVQLQATEIGLKNALGQQVQAQTAWTDLCLAVLNNFPNQKMSAVEVRNVLESWGYTFTGINNPLAFINTCLQRLADRGQIVRSQVGRPFRFGRK